VPERSLTVTLSSLRGRWKSTISTTVGVHRDLPLRPDERQPPLVGAHRDVLVPAGTVEHHRVAAILALDHVAAVAVIPDEGVVPVAERGGVGAFAANHRVVAVAALEPLVARPAV